MIRIATVALLTVVVVGSLGYWYVYRPAMQREYRLKQTFSVSRLATMTTDEAKAALQAKTERSFDEWLRTTIDTSTFVSADEARYVGGVFMMSGEKKKALASYAVAQEMLGEEADIDFYIEYGQLAARAGDASLVDSMKKAALASVANSGLEEGKKRAEQRWIEDVFSEI